MTSRTVDVSLQRELEKQESAEALLVFLTISHKSLEDDIRVVADTKTYTRSAGLFQAFWFDIQLLTDNDSPPTTRLEVQNVDLEIGNIVRKIETPPKVKIELLPLSDFDLTATPRTVLSTEHVIYSAEELFMTNISVDDLVVSADIISWAYTQEEWPGIRATQFRCPGLFR